MAEIPKDGRIISSAAPSVDGGRRRFMANTGGIAGLGAVGITPSLAALSNNPYCNLTATQAVSAMSAGDMKAESYAQALVDRCEALRHLNAFITLDKDRVLESARKADQLRAAGRKLGPLHGLPIPVKDSINTRGLATTSGTPALKKFVPKEDAPVVKALLDAGAIVLGKTNLHELSFGWTSNNLAFGAVHNPYDPTRNPGGSSGGTAVAVATRMAPVGLGEDTCGSIRVPAALTGIAGYRPSKFRWSAEGVMPLTTIFDTVGPQARSVADLALIDTVVAGDAARLTPPNLRGMRIGVIRDFYFSDVDSEVARVTEAALGRLKDAGVEIIEGSLPELEALWQITAFPIIQHETRATVTEYLDRFGTGVSWDALVAAASEDIKRDFGLFVADNGQFHAPREAYESARQIHRPALQNAFRRYFRAAGVSAIVYPATMTAALPIGGEMDNAGQLEINGKKLPFYVALARNIAPAGTAGLPSLVLPAGLTREGLPVGLEFDAPVGRDKELLALGFALEAALGAIEAPNV